MPRKENRTPETKNAPFPTAIRAELKERNITQKTLADYLGIKRQTVSQYCLGNSSPDFNTLCKIADYFEVSADYLLGRRSSEQNDLINQISELEKNFNEERERLMKSLKELSK